MQKSCGGLCVGAAGVARSGHSPILAENDLSAKDTFSLPWIAAQNQAKSAREGCSSKRLSLHSQATGFGLTHVHTKSTPACGGGTSYKEY